MLNERLCSALRIEVAIALGHLTRSSDYWGRSTEPKAIDRCSAEEMRGDRMCIFAKALIRDRLSGYLVTFAGVVAHFPPAFSSWNLFALKR